MRPQLLLAYALRWLAPRPATWALLLGLLAAGPAARAQQLLDFAYVDSLSQALLEQHRYQTLDSVGRAARALGTDYPALRRRLGAGALATGRLAAALRYYGAASHENPLDSAAQLGLAFTYQAYNQPGPAALLARPLPVATRQALGLPAPGALVGAEVAVSVLPTTERTRGTATYERLSASSRLSSRLLLTQEVSYYGQQVELPRRGSPGAVEPHFISQGQYHALLTGQLSPRWQAKAGYDFITRDLGSNHLGYLALAYARPVWTAQLGLYTGELADTARTQTDLRLTVYPLGNLRLYGFGRGSLVASSGRNYANGLLGAGGRLRPWLWAEAWMSAGGVPVLAELDGTYVYNLLDPLRRRTAASLLILAPRQLSIRLTYGTEQRHISLANVAYVLHSFTFTLASTW